MHMSRLFGQRQRAARTDVRSASHDLLTRAGWIRQHASGIYSFLAPGLKSLRRIEAIVRAEMVCSGAQEILMPFVHSADAWKATGRWASVDETLVRFRDRRGHDLVLGMTHEEIVAQLAASEITSYREAGVVVFQIQTKFRDEARPRAGLLRTREFLMKDAYSIHVDRAGMLEAYDQQEAAYVRIFRRVGLDDVRTVASATGDMGGEAAHEFMALMDVGEDTVGLCASCGAGSNAELLAAYADCTRCGGEIARRRAVEVGNIFQLGTRYSRALGATALGADGQRRDLWMGSYGIGISRLLAVLVESSHDDAGIALPAVCNAFDVHVMSIGNEQADRAADVAVSLEASGVDVLYEDRDVRTGEKFADADLIGATLRVVMGGRNVAEDRLEIRERRTGRIHEVDASMAVDGIAAILRDVRRAEDLSSP